MMITLAEIEATGLPLSDHGAIASALSVGRTKLVPTEIGNGKIIETIGLVAGNELLDIIYTNNDFRYVKPLVEQGRLDVSSALVRATLDTITTPQNAEALKALAEQPDPVSALEVALTIERG
jgi:hypothetical protein